MCILQPCANPTGVGVWWRDDTKWAKYGPTHDTLIRNGISQRLTSIDLGTITSTVYPKGARYTADLQKMEQVAVSSGQRRAIKVIDRPAPQPSQISVPQLTLHAASPRGNATARVHYRDSSGQLQEYDQDVGHALLRAVVSGTQRSVILEEKKSGKFLNFDLETMEQVVVEQFTASGEQVLSDEPPLKVIIVVLWDPETMGKLVHKAEGTMRRKILVLTVERLRSEEHLDATLPKRAYPRTVVSKRADLGTFPGHPAYEGFVSALEATLAGFPNGIESFIKLTIPGDDAKDSRVQMVFRPVEKKRTGSNSDKRAFWSSMAALIAAAHAVVCGSAVLQIMAYLVILPATVEVSNGRKTNRLEETEVLIDRRDHCLSLAEVNVR